MQDERDEEHVAYMHKDYSLSQKNALGDEVFDLPVMGGEWRCLGSA